MNTARLWTLFCLAVFAQGALGATIWLKDRNGNVCYNSLSTLGGPPPGAPGGYIGLGGINRDGSGYQMQISNPTAGVVTPATGDCTTLPKSDSILSFSGGSVAPYKVAVSMVKPGTKGNNECLEQGVNLMGLNGGSSTVVGTVTWTLAYSYASATGCKPGTEAPPSLFEQRSVSLARKAGAFSNTTYRGTYHIYNESNPIPEPSITLLLLAGALGLGTLGVWRQRARPN